MKPKAIVLIILSIIFVILIVQNSDPIKVNILFWSIHMSQVIVFFLILIIGFIGGYFAARIDETKKEERRNTKSRK